MLVFASRLCLFLHRMSQVYLYTLKYQPKLYTLYIVLIKETVLKMFHQWYIIKGNMVWDDSRNCFSVFPSIISVLTKMYANNCASWEMLSHEYSVQFCGFCFERRNPSMHILKSYIHFQSTYISCQSWMGGSSFHLFLRQGQIISLGSHTSQWRERASFCISLTQS